MSYMLLGLPYDEWLDAFPPIDDSEVDYEDYHGLFDGVVTDETEFKMYGPLVKAVNRAKILGDFVLAETHARYDKTDKNRMKVDGGMYPKGSPAIEQQRTDWASVEVFIECKTSDGYDPYDENTSSGIPYAEAKRDALGQIMTYASTVFEYQHLTHHFGIVILGSLARLGRWDRSGIVFSEKFDYKEEPEKLVRFFWRVAHATPEARGHDPTATRVLKGSTDYKTLNAWKTKEVDDDDYVAKRFVKSLTDSRPWWRLTVADSKHGKQDFLVGQPTFAAPGVVGRGTRGYIALRVSHPRDESPFVYLKDCWRVLHERSQLEGDILSHLNDTGISNVPTALYHGDVEDHRTISQGFCKCGKSGCVAEIVNEGAVEDTVDNPGQNTKEIAEGAGNEVPDGTTKEALAETGGHLRVEGSTGKEPKANAAGAVSVTAVPRCHVKAHRHYRLVVKEVGLPLQEFPCGRILLWVIRDAVIAYTKANVIHRDISVGNILIIPRNGKNKKTTYQGLLADWELSKRLGDYKAKARHPDRTGTWQFMSVYMQDHPEAQVEIADELESFLHVMIYCAIRYLTHTCGDVGRFMYSYFDDGERRQQQETEYTCEVLKRLVSKTAELTTLSNDPIIFLRRPYDPGAQPKKPSPLSQYVFELELVTPSEIPPEDEHPINDIIAHLLVCFSARYRLLYLGSRRSSKPKPKHYFSDDSSSDDSSSDDPPSDDSSDDDGETKELKSKSKKIECHSYMIKLLKEASDKKARHWPGPEDRTADQLAPDFNPNKAHKTQEKRPAPEAEAEEPPASKRHCSAASRG
ncbi:hypothetical protein FKP32DRAFT_840879 [Trametes sanguinea]|nr:hypothetical protein FKP32DRAFT_840879 [Trametes sanguinea]